MDKKWIQTLIALAAALTACNARTDSVIQAQPSTSSEKQNVLTGKFFNIEGDVNVYGRV